MPVDLRCKTLLVQYTEEDVQKILSEYGRTVADLEVDVETMKEWFKTQPHIPEVPSDRLIASFLLMNKFSIEKTKARLEMYYSIRNLMPEYYSKTPAQASVKRTCQYAKLAALPKLTEDLRRIIILKFERSEEFDIPTLISRLVIGYEMLAIYDFNRGDECIVDYSNITFSMISKLSPVDIKRVVTILEKVYSNRFASIHIINLPPSAETLLDIFKACLKPHLRNRLLCHSSVDSLKTHFAAELLPKEYGGDGKSLDEIVEECNRFFESQDDYFAEWIKIRVDEKLRPEPLRNDDILGYHGNFRRLDVD